MFVRKQCNKNNSIKLFIYLINIIRIMREKNCKLNEKLNITIIIFKNSIFS